MSVDPLLSALKAKDDDLTAHVGEDGSIYIETDLSAAESIGLREVPQLPDVSDVIDDGLLEREADMPTVDVSVTIITTMFLVTALVSMVCMLVGAIPYFLLKYDESGTTTIVFFSVSSGMFVASYIAMLFFREKDGAKYAFLGWAFVLVIWLGSLASIMRHLAPFQTMGMFFAQSIGVYIYGRLERRYVSPLWAGLIMLGATVAVWLINLYAFITLRDWVTAGVMLVVGLLVSAYSVYQIRHVDRYHISEKQKVLAVIQFYGDPVLIPLRYLVPT